MNPGRCITKKSGPNTRKNGTAEMRKSHQVWATWKEARSSQWRKLQGWVGEPMSKNVTWELKGSPAQGGGENQPGAQGEDKGRAIVGRGVCDLNQGRPKGWKGQGGEYLSWRIWDVRAFSNTAWKELARKLVGCREVGGVYNQTGCWSESMEL